MSFLLDTNVWLFTVGQKAKIPADLAADLAQDTVSISAITLWEVAKLHELRRIELDRPLEDWLRDAAARINVIPIDAAIAADSAGLAAQGFHQDPADQLIVATARCHGLDLVHTDTRIRRFPHVAGRFFRNSPAAA